MNNNTPLLVAIICMLLSMWVFTVLHQATIEKQLGGILKAVEQPTATQPVK